jgi:hypothetical protein
MEKRRVIKVRAYIDISLSSPRLCVKVCGEKRICSTWIQAARRRKAASEKEEEEGESDKAQDPGVAERV